MRVALYVPPVPDRNTTPILGPLYILAVLERNGFNGRLFDARIDKGAFQKLVSFGPDIVGVSAVTAGYRGGLRAAYRIRQALPQVKIVFGGPHPTSMHEDVLMHSCVDFVALGEAEGCFSDLCLYLRGGADGQVLRAIQGLAYKESGTVVSSTSVPVEDLDSLPFPAFHRMDLKAYFAGTQAHGLFSKGKRILTLMTARGCPFSCTFCCRTMGKKLRSRSVESVMQEVRFLVDRYGIDELYIEDDNFTVLRERALILLEHFARFHPPLHIKFANGIRADLIDRELLTAMKRARVYSLSFGVESGSRKTLDLMKKALDLEKARENVLLAKSMGFLVGANCIVGYPGETHADIDESLQFFMGLPLDSMAIVNMVPFPGTEVRILCEREGYLTEEAKNWDNYYFNLNNPIPLIETPVLPKGDLVALIRKAYRKMYLRPRWIKSNVRHVSWRNLAVGIGILFGRRRRHQVNAQ